MGRVSPILGPILWTPSESLFGGSPEYWPHNGARAGSMFLGSSSVHLHLSGDRPMGSHYLKITVLPIGPCT